MSRGLNWVFALLKSSRSARRNKTSATQHTSVIDAYLTKEVSLGRVAGPFDPPSPNLQISSFGVTPKTGQTGNWCLNVDLSSLAGVVGGGGGLEKGEGASVNDGISPDKFTLHYITVDQKLFT